LKIELHPSSTLLNLVLSSIDQVSWFLFLAAACWMVLVCA
jgi:hypothetical protein